MTNSGTPHQLWCATQRKTLAAYTRILNGMREIGNLLLPPVCPFCQQELPRQCDQPRFAPYGLCQSCRQQLTEIRRRCVRCASALPKHWPQGANCPQCQQRRFYFERAIALGEYKGGLQQAVLAAKKLSYEPLSHALGALLADQVVHHLTRWAPDVIAPVPMHFWRRLTRGTQPSLLLGESIATRTGLPMCDDLLYCRRKSKKQGTLSVPERFRNRRGAFSISPGYDITDVRVLLVDDVLTTGATSSEAAHVLRRAGASAVAVAVVARAVGRR